MSGARAGDDVPIAEEPVVLSGNGPDLPGSLYCPAGPTAAGVVICDPLFDEGRSAQRSLVLLARRLAARGVAVLRFDYRGCGDSPADLFGVTLSDFLNDVDRAAGFLRERTRESPLGLLGVRLGGAFVWMAARRGLPLDFLILWQPVVKGEPYIRRELQRKLVRESVTTGSGGDRGSVLSAMEESGELDLDGYRLPANLYHEICGVDLTSGPVSVGAKRLLVQIGHLRKVDRDLQLLCDASHGGEIAVAVEKPFWDRVDPEVPHTTISITLRWVEEFIAEQSPPPDRIRPLTSPLRPVGSYPQLSLPLRGEGKGGGKAPPPRLPHPGGGKQDTELWVTVSSAGRDREGGGEESLTGLISGEGFEEHRCRFDVHGEPVRGVLCAPVPGLTVTPGPPAVGVVLLHGWGSCRCGPHRLLVDAARRLAAEGVPSLRFDFRGRGESGGSGVSATLDGMIEDAAAGAQFVQEATGAGRIVLVGLCSGGNVAIGAATLDRRVDSLALWSTLTFAPAQIRAGRWKHSLQMARQYARKLRDPDTWKRLLRGRINLRMSSRAIMGERHENRCDKDSARDIMSAFGQFGGRLFFCHGGADAEGQAAAQVYRAFCETRGMPAVFHTIPGANHNFYSTAWRRELIEMTVQWILARRGSGEAGRP